jgi:apolipoprotein N-acyltransferase
VVDTPVAEALPYVGAVGVSFVLALSGALLAWLVGGPVAGEGSR